MSSNETAILVQELSKCYQIYNTPRDRLKQFIVPTIKRITRQVARQYFREFWALRNISFEVKRGETVGIVGSNGSGKSTLLQIICGTLAPSTGRVETRGRVAALLELGSGFNPEFTGRENVYLNASVLGLTHEEIDNRFDAIAAFADIGDFIERPVKTYSSGMFVRLAFAVQAQINPDILIVDEALAVGDEKFQRKCYARMEDMKNDGASILFVSHSAASVIELCDRAMLINHGERLIFGNPADVIRAYQKLIYSPINDQCALIEQYKTMDENGDASTPKVVSIASNVEEELLSNSASHIAAVTSGYDASLVPETTIIYPEQGAKIDSFEILDDSRRRVNVLIPGKNYSINVQGRFLADRHSVYLAFHIRSVSGMVLTGQRYPAEGENIGSVRCGQHFSITYNISMDLLPGIYFVGGGVWSNHEPNCLHRALDMLMFRVQPCSYKHSFGVYDAMSDLPSAIISQI